MKDTPKFIGILPPMSIIGVFTLIIAIICTVFPPQTLFSTARIDLDTVEQCLNDGYEKVKTSQTVREYISVYIVSRYTPLIPADPVYDGNAFIYKSDNATVEINFTPELSEFAERVDTYCQSVNATLSFFGATGTEENDTEIDGNVAYLDENDNIWLNDYGQELLNSVESEYTNSTGSSYQRTLKRHAESMFSAGLPYTWIDNTYIGTKTIQVDSFFRRVSGNFDMWEEIDESLYVENDIRYKKESTDKEVPALLGTITIPLSCDPTFYKKDEINKLVRSLVGKEMPVPKDNEGKDIEIKVIESEEEASIYVERIRATYEATYIMMYPTYSDAEWGVGKVGQLNNVPDMETEAFWATYGQRGSYWWNLLHPNGSYGAGYRQCTYYASIILYLNFDGVTTGNAEGVNSADYVVSHYPDRFCYSTTASAGAVISLYPNHVAIVDEVTESGGVYISEGNYNGSGGIRTHVYYSSLQEYAHSMNMTIRNIAIPKE